MEESDLVEYYLNIFLDKVVFIFWFEVGLSWKINEVFFFMVVILLLDFLLIFWLLFIKQVIILKVQL